MKKIPSLFQRNYDGDRLVRDEVVPGCEWVLAGEGEATRKYDGTACLVLNGKLFKRYDHRPANWGAIQKANRFNREAPIPVWASAPDGFKPAQESPDPITFHFPGWLPVKDCPEDAYHNEAWAGGGLSDGTYELLGPKIQGNPDCFDHHTLLRHGCVALPNAPRTFTELKAWFERNEVEGIVWHHPDGRMAKIKRKDFGYPWPMKK